MKIHILGTGQSDATECYHSCFCLENKGEFFLVDGGGGNPILSQLKKAKINLFDIKNIFISHKHTDHILGIVWVLRWLTHGIKSGKVESAEAINVYASAETLGIVKQLCNLLLNKRHLDQVEKMNFIPIVDNETREICGMSVRFFDILSKKDEQFGFDINDKFFVFAGDEPLNELFFEKFMNCEWLIHESFCLDSEKEIFNPYEKTHCTVVDAGKVAKALNAKNLIIWHTADNQLATRKENYTKEAKQVFDGNVFVPDDLDVITLL